MTAHRDQYLQRLGIVRWQLRSADIESAAASAPEDTVEDVASPTDAQAAASVPGPASDWQALEAQVAACTACGLHSSRTQTVFGVGNRDAEWMIIGEAPGQEEDRRGEPFVGPAGQLLDRMLLAVGFARSEVFIANILKCRPPDNRDPQPQEVDACIGYLRQQIAWVAPKLILCVGRIAAQTLLATDASTSKLRGKVHHVNGI
ncbi:MAG: uracil-DNA glycosylase, partial [Proteobacteria bacterium]|nr:uracil-DNA glycosylase [Pseudomonadota bacterium]